MTDMLDGSLSSVTIADMADRLINRHVSPEHVAIFRHLTAFWFRIAENGHLPQRSDFGPQDIVFALPDLFLAERTRKGMLRYRLVGTRLAGKFDRDPTTREIGISRQPWETDLIAPMVARVFNNGQPSISVSPAENDAMSPADFAAIAFPIYNETAEVKMVLGAVMISSAARLQMLRLNGVDEFALAA